MSDKCRICGKNMKIEIPNLRGTGIKFIGPPREYHQTGGLDCILTLRTSQFTEAKKEISELKEQLKVEMKRAEVAERALKLACEFIDVDCDHCIAKSVPPDGCDRSCSEGIYEYLLLEAKNKLAETDKAQETRNEKTIFY